MEFELWKRHRSKKTHRKGEVVKKKIMKTKKKSQKKRSETSMKTKRWKQHNPLSDSNCLLFCMKIKFITIKNPLRQSHIVHGWQEEDVKKIYIYTYV